MSEIGISESLASQSLLTPDVAIMSEVVSEKLERKNNSGKNPDLEMKYPERYQTKSEGRKVSVQLHTSESKMKPDVLKTAEGYDVDIVARIWVTKKGDNGTGEAVCYKMDKDGVWYKQSADSYRYDNEKDTNYWNLSQPGKMTQEESKELRSKYFLKV